jgi:hypothetical protein
MLPDRMGDMGPATLTPEQRAAVRSAIRQRLADDMRGSVGEKLAEAAAALNTLSPDCPHHH